jgi:hypothetical protein
MGPVKDALSIDGSTKQTMRTKDAEYESTWRSASSLAPTLMPATTSATSATSNTKLPGPRPRKKGLKKKATKRDAANSPSPRVNAKQSKYDEELAFENTISRILLHRFEYDIARLFSTHIHRIAESQLPRLIMSVLQIASPGWIALNAASEEVKDCKPLSGIVLSLVSRV